MISDRRRSVFFFEKFIRVNNITTDLFFRNIHSAYWILPLLFVNYNIIVQTLLFSNKNHLGKCSEHFQYLLKLSALLKKIFYETRREFKNGSLTKIWRRYSCSILLRYVKNKSILLLLFDKLNLLCNMVSCLVSDSSTK
jgi:hypothetical protein